MRRLLAVAGLIAGLGVHAALATELPLVAGLPAAGAVGSDVVESGETLMDVARRDDLGYTQLVAANRGIDPWLPAAGSRIVVPSFYLLPEAPHRGIVVNLAEERLFYYPLGGRTVETYPIGIAVDEGATPLGTTRIVAKVARPPWYPPASIHAQRPELPRAIPPGPDDPLGAFALFLGWPGFLIHGTNKPDSVGRHVSHGCFHLYPEDVARLYREVPIGTPVDIVNQPVELQWVGDALFLEVHPSADQAEALESGGTPPPSPPADLVARVTAAAGDDAARIDWPAVARAGLERDGIPVQVATRASSLRLVRG
ncbi:MAG TPA: L,D-transpeptidase family protein [Stellaceae bacterium]|nr:L,D-transpeptidase family protein [Stellaceae bacterium]